MIDQSALTSYFQIRPVLIDFSYSWLMLKYPVPLKKRVLLARLYYELCVLPGMPTHLLSTWVDGLSVLLHSKRKTSIRDLRLPWKPIFDILKKDLFLTRRQFEIRHGLFVV